RPDLLLLEALDHVLADVRRRGLDSHREHPAAGALEAMDERRVDEVVGSRVAEPADPELALDQLVAERAEALLVQRDRVAPEIEVPDAELAPGALDLVDQRPGIALAELVPLVNRRDAEVARVRTPATGLDDDVRFADHRQPVVRERHEIPGREGHAPEPG